jgi:hypothetical protein
MKVSISQPTVFPWIGYFNIIKNSDVFVFLDNVKFEKRSWQMRNRIKFASKTEEKEIWIHVPTKLEQTDTLIRDVMIDNAQKWREKHLKTFLTCYGKDFQEIYFLNEVYNKEWIKLADFNIECIKMICNYLEIKTRLIKASELPVTGKKGHLLLNICKYLDANEYFSAAGSRNYLEKLKKDFEESGIKIIYHNFEHPTYKQRGNIFMDHLSVLDLIFNEKQNARNFI